MSEAETCLRVGHVVVDDDGESIVLALTPYKALLLHVSDGLPGTWTKAELVSTLPRLADAAVVYTARAVDADRGVDSDLFFKGSHYAMHTAARAGAWRTLAALVSALLVDP